MAYPTKSEAVNFALLGVVLVLLLVLVGLVVARKTTSPCSPCTTCSLCPPTTSSPVKFLYKFSGTVSNPVGTIAFYHNSLGEKIAKLSPKSGTSVEYSGLLALMQSSKSMYLRGKTNTCRFASYDYPYAPTKIDQDGTWTFVVWETGTATEWTDKEDVFVSFIQ
jgi:hypothetical protein